jgi:hypothetical protein
MTAALPLIPGEDPELLDARTIAWKQELNPQGDLQEYLVEQIVASSVQVARCGRAIAARLKELIEFGPFDLEETEAQEVADLTRQLFWDPRGPIALYPHFRSMRYTPRISTPESVNDPLDPNKLVESLQVSYTGCRWLLDRWAELRSWLEQGLKWQAPDRLKAIRMLGRQPMDAVADERVLSIYLACDAMDPTAPTSLDDLFTETTPDELKLFKERVRGRGADGKKPADPSAGQVALYRLIDQVTAGLRAKLAVHQKRREFIQAARLDLFALDESKEGEQARRYQSAKVRELSRLLVTYFKVGKETAADRRNGADSGGAGVTMTPEPMPATGPVPGEAAAADASRTEMTEPIPPAGPVPVEPEVTVVGPVEPIGEGRDETSAIVESCSVSFIQSERMADGPIANETNPMAAGASACETNPISAAGSADETNPIPPVGAADETSPISAPGVASADETNPISAPVVASADRTNRMSPDVAMLEALLEDMRRRAAVLSAAGYPVPIPR